jgi:hypothetical protein
VATGTEWQSPRQDGSAVTLDAVRHFLADTGWVLAAVLAAVGRPRGPADRVTPPGQSSP